MVESKQIQGNLASPSTQQDVGLLVEDLAKQISPLQAYQALQELQQNMSYAQLDETAAQFYRRQLTLLKFAAFSFLKHEEQIRLLQASLVSALRAGVDVRGQIEHIFLPNFLGNIHEQKVRDLTQALEGAGEKLGQNPINVGGQLSPEVRNWLLDFKNFSGGKTSAYEIVNYLTNNQNAKSLALADKEVLRDLLVLYRWIKFDAVPKDYLEPASLEEAEQVIEEIPQAPKPAPRPLPVHLPKPKEQKRERLPIFTKKEETNNKALRRAQAANASVPLKAESAPARQDSPVFTEDYTAFSSKTAPNQASEEAIKNLENISSQESEGTLSLSGSLINSGSGADVGVEKGMRPGSGGKKSAEESEAFKINSNIEKTSEQAIPPAKPALGGASEELLSVLQKAGTAPAPGNASNIEESSKYKLEKKDSGVIDLKKNTPIELSDLNEPMQLGRVKLSDLRNAGFENGLNIIKQKIRLLSEKHELPAKQVASYFFRSPGYSQYTNTVVAITNDPSGDQRAAFEKLNKQLQASGKDYLNREEFLAFHKFKKELPL